MDDEGVDLARLEEPGVNLLGGEYALAVEVLKELDLTSVRLLSNNPDKAAAVERAGIRVSERVPCEVEPSAHAEQYLKTKKEKMGHLFTAR